MIERDNSYQGLMSRKNEIMKAAVGVDYSQFESGGLSFDYEAMMASTGYSLEDVIAIQRDLSIGRTPIIELKNLTALARHCAPPGLGARIFIKDEAANPSGSFKVRRAAICMYEGEINMVIHADGGSAEVEVDLDQITLRMIDHGPGIPNLGKAMEEGFSTAGPEVRSLGFGAGMGLPNMKRYSDAMEIDTQVGRGTTVTMRIRIG